MMIIASPMKKHAFAGALRYPALSLGMFCVLVPAVAADKGPPPAQAATSYGDVDSHPAEHVSIAAEPFTGTRADFFKLNYPAYGIMPVRMIVNQRWRYAHLAGAGAHRFHYCCR